MTEIQKRVHEPFGFLSLIAGLTSIGLGSVVMLGWHLRLPSVIQILPIFVPMQYNTAVGFLMVGVALVSATLRRWSSVGAIGWGVCCIGALTLTEHVFSADFGIDQILMEHYITVGTSEPGRMAPNTALCFFLAGLAFIFLGRARSGTPKWRIIGIISALILGLSLVPLIGYIIGLSTAYGWGQLTRMAVHTAVGFVVVSLGLMGLSSQGNLFRSDWLPWAVGVATSTVTFMLWEAFEKGSSTSAVLPRHFVLVFGLILALALARSLSISQKLRLSMQDKEESMALLRQEVAERKRIEAQVRELAFFDPLTHLPNRRLMNEHFALAIATSKRSGIFGAIIFLDLDNFKQINDKHGHAVGDLLLIEAAERIRACVRESDTVARLGGDEFVVILHELSDDKAAASAQAEQVALKISLTLSVPYQIGIDTDRTAEHRSSGSAGVALFGPQDVEAPEILRRADASMYQAKRAGRNKVMVYQDTAAADTQRMF